jgi:SepF-like predicted cell division protein (DUF552 family)
MGVLDALFGGNNRRESMSFDEVMNSMDDRDVDVLHGPADFYVKPISLESDADLASVDAELKAGNIVLLNIGPVSRNPAKLKDAISMLNSYAAGVDGDIARISEDKVLLTPKRIKISKRPAKKQ